MCEVIFKNEQKVIMSSSRLQRLLSLKNMRKWVFTYKYLPEGDVV